MCDEKPIDTPLTASEAVHRMRAVTCGDLDDAMRDLKAYFDQRSGDTPEMIPAGWTTVDESLDRTMRRMQDLEREILANIARRAGEIAEEDDDES